MPSSEALREYANEYYEKNKERLRENRRKRYPNRDSLILENDKLRKENKELSEKLLASIEGRKFIKKEVELPEIVINKGSYNVSFE
jgi:hypothetical protein